MSSILTSLHLVLAVAVALRVLARPDLNSSTRIVWIFVLGIVPLVGVILYFYFGEVIFRGRSRRRYQDAVDATRKLVEESGEKPDLERWGSASGFATAINGFGVTEGNHAQLLDSPKGAREQLIADIEGATESVSLLYYIWLDDQTGRATAEAMIGAVQRGVRCRVMIDAIGSRIFARSETWRRMINAGVETSVALPLGNPFLTMMLRRLDLRNHRKITLIDGRILYCGSQNCADPEFRVKPKYAPWVDIMVRFEGPVVRQMNLLFAQDWMVRNPADLAVSGPAPTPFKQGFDAQVVGTGPMISRGVSGQLFARLIQQAQRELIVSTPYFVPGDIVANALMGAAMAGAEVTLIVPKRNDSGFVARASRSYYPMLVAAGVRIAEYNGGLLHSKTLTIDGETTFIGSSNMDIRSFDLNFENDILLTDRKMTQQIRERQMLYLANSTPVDPREVLNWSVFRRIEVNLFAIVGPIL